MTEEIKAIFDKLDKVYADSEEKFLKHVVLYTYGGEPNGYLYFTKNFTEENRLDKYALLEVFKNFDIVATLVDNDLEQGYLRALGAGLSPEGTYSSILVAKQGGIDELYSKEFSSE